MFCTSCGKQIEDNSRFCIYCGKQLTLPDNNTERHADEPSETADASMPKKREESVTVPPTDEKRFAVDQEQKPAPEPPAQAPTPPPPQPKPKEPVDLTKYENVFKMIFVLTGVAGLFTYGLMIPSTIMFANGFSAFLGVIAMLLAMGNIVFAILRFVNSFKASPEEKAKNKFRNITLFAIGIMLFVFLMISCIMCFGVVARVNG